MRYLFLLFIVLPIIELSLLIRVGSAIGVLPTVALVVGTAIAGIYLLRQQGVHTLFRINQRLAAGEVPAREMLEGVILAAGGVFLLAPGIITDTLGLLCILPATRALLIQFLAKRVRVGAFGQPQGPFDYGPGPTGPTHRPGQPPLQPGQSDRRPEIIEGEYRRDDD